MKMKKITTILAISLLTVSVARAQIFVTENNYENPRDGIETEWGHIPQQWTTNDQANEFAPLGSGVLLLTALGVAYLLNTKKKRNK